MSENPGSARAAQILTQNPATFAEALRTLDKVEGRSAEQTAARRWMILALEARYPAASQAVEDAYVKAEHTGAEVDYVAVLLSAAQL